MRRLHAGLIFKLFHLDERMIEVRSSYITIPSLEEKDGVLHAFTTRKGGLGMRRNGAKVPGDWDAVAEALGIRPECIVTVNQVHGDDIVGVDRSNFPAMPHVKADGMVTSSPGIAIGVETADCVPVLLFDPGAPAVAAVHAGWRSTVKNIVGKTVIRMRKSFGSNPTRMIAAIGPAIGPECYEVDEPVIGPLRAAFPFWRDLLSPRSGGRWGLDLAKANRMVLIQSGLLEENIYSLGMCTSCNRELFYSYRREGRTGRMLSVIMIRT